MMRNIPLKCLLGGFAVVSITGCDAIASKGFCQKTDKGYEICIKKENISCVKSSRMYEAAECKGIWNASGISTSLTGEENHWVTSRYSYCALDQNGNLHSRSGKGNITCKAVKHFGMVNMKYNPNGEDVKI